MECDQTISFDEIIREVRDEIDRLPANGKIEIVIYKSNNVLANYDIRPTRTRRGKIALNRAE